MRFSVFSFMRLAVIAVLFYCKTKRRVSKQVDWDRGSRINTWTHMIRYKDGRVHTASVVYLLIGPITTRKLLAMRSSYLVQHSNRYQVLTLEKTTTDNTERRQETSPVHKAAQLWQDTPPCLRDPPGEDRKQLTISYFTRTGG